MTADDWYASCDTWHDEVAALRAILLDRGLAETLKWRQPCYLDRDRNIALVGTRKDGAIVSLFKGALLDDPDARLLQAGRIRSARYLLFPDLASLDASRTCLEGLLDQAVAAERAGLRVEALPDTLDPVDALAERLATDPAFAEAFERLTPGRQRQYNHHFGSAKRAATNEGRVEACSERILQGYGLTDCTCGRSRRMPRCDGSHRRSEETG